MTLTFIKQYPLLHARLTGLFLLSFLLFFFIHDIFMVTIQNELNYLFRVVAESSGITNIRPSLLSLLSAVFWYAISLFLVFLGTQTSIWFEAKTKPSFSDKFTSRLLIISIFLGLFFTGISLLFDFITFGPTAATTFIGLILFFFIIIYSKCVSWFNFHKIFSFLKQYAKIVGVAVLLYIIIISFNLLLSIGLLYRMGQNPYDVFGIALTSSKWILHAILFHYIIFASACSAKQIGSKSCKSVSIKKTFLYAFGRKESYISSGVFLVYLLIIFLAGSGLLLLPNGNAFNFIFMTIFFLGGFVALFVKEASTK